MMKKILSLLAVILFTASIIFLPARPVQAAEETAVQEEGGSLSTPAAKALSAGIAIAVAAGAGAIAMGLAIGKAAESIGRQPEAAGNIRTSLMLGLVFIETAIIYALIVAILVIFVL